jgi:hypothetical protein
MAPSLARGVWRTDGGFAGLAGRGLKEITPTLATNFFSDEGARNPLKQGIGRDL